ncbi:MAG TPA: efflux RND transporter permease subunit, partial [Gammaproteobacteria bacterium]|nr:efflux RND transporter permease subunit [Gammaproteobacteria bacterium]
TRATSGLMLEGGLGVLLTGVMVLLFLADWRSAAIVVVNIPLALLGAVVALSVTGQTINIMTLGGLALAIGILVDMSTVVVENIHTHLAGGKRVARAVLDSGREVAVPLLISMLCVLSVFLPSFFMTGAARAMFLPLSLAVGFAMVASYLLSSTLVPILSVWFLRGHEKMGSDPIFAADRSGPDTHPRPKMGSDPIFSAASFQAPKTGSDPIFSARLRRGYAGLAQRAVRARWLVAGVYVVAVAAVIALLGPRLGTDIYPIVEAGQLQVRLRAPTGTGIDGTEAIALKALDLIRDEVGADNVAITLGFLGVHGSSYPINFIYQWNGGTEEGVLQVQLKRGSGIDTEALKERLRARLAHAMPDVAFSFEPSDIVSQVMSLGAATPIEVAVSGPDLDTSRAFAAKIRDRLEKIPALRDVQFGQALDYPTLQVNVDRERAGLMGVGMADISRSLVSATSSSRFVVPNYWADPRTGVAYQIQVEIPHDELHSVDELGNVPVAYRGDRPILLRSVAKVTKGTAPGQYARYNMQRLVTITANIQGADLGSVAQEVREAIAAAGTPPPRTSVALRGQVVPMQEMLGGLQNGLLLAIAIIFLLLMANFQSAKLALIVASTMPAAIAGVVLALWLTGTTLNIQSFMGAVMAVGVAVANAILLVTFAERARMRGAAASDAAVEGGASRLRPILMTSAAMIAGMLPIAIGFGEAGDQTAPLGRAVVGGLAAATLATLFVLPAVFAIVQARGGRRSVSLDPDDPASAEHVPAG